MIRLTSLLFSMTLSLLALAPSASANTSADACYFNICDGDWVTTMSGPYQGLTGIAERVDPRSGYFNLMNQEEGMFVMHASQVQRGYYPPSCLYGFCLGNRTMLMTGSMRGLISWIEGFRPGRRMVLTRDSRGRRFLLRPTSLRLY